MPMIEPFVRELGSGPGVVCVHANASSSSQWRSLMERLAPHHLVLAADSYGAGRTPAWAGEQAITLSDETALLEPVFARAGTPFTLIGHSYGGAVALMAALAQPQRLRALVLFEPTLFSLLEAERGPPNEVDGIREIVDRAGDALDAGDADTAARLFIDYWMGTQAWALTPEARRQPILASIVNVRSWGRALRTEPTPLAAFATLRVPVLYMVGKDSPASSRAVARLLCGVLPQVQLVEFEGLGHMGPVTDPDRVNDAIVRYLQTA